MTSRRAFLQIGITASAWPLASSAVRAAGAELPGADPLALYKVIYDQRFADSTAFADRAAALGLPVHAIDGDMTRFWYDELYHRWKQGPAAIAGLTAHGPMFCFEQLAQDQGMRVVFRAEHQFGPGGDVEHELTGPLSMLQHSLALNGGRADWAACMAEVVAHCPKGRAEISCTAAASAARLRSAAPDSESLYSWVIAPAVRV
jgi:hypothetical protein